MAPPGSTAVKSSPSSFSTLAICTCQLCLHTWGKAESRAGRSASSKRVPSTNEGHVDVARHVIQRGLNPRLESQMASDDVAGTVCQAPSRGNPVLHGFKV